MLSEKQIMITEKKIQKRVKLVPPDGGWGWMVLTGTALSNVVNQSMLSLFSLLYGDALEAMGHQTSGAAIVLSTLLFVTNFGGPIAGAIINLTSPRFVAVTGACFCTSGIFLSGFSTNIYHLMCTYGVLLGLGLGFIQNSSFVAINSYFTARKSRAVGLANVGTGVGQTVMPHLVRYLLENYGFKYSCLMLSGLSLNGICGTLLIQPVEWHMKKVEEYVEIDENLELLDMKHKDIIVRQNSSQNFDKIKNFRRSTEPNLFQDGKQKASIKSNSYKELPYGKISKSNENFWHGNNNNIDVKEQPMKNKSIWKKIYDLFDISLLSSPRFVMIVVGSSLATVSIQNFSMLYPLFLQKAAYMDKTMTANCMSAVSAADICGRLILPYFQDKYHIGARWMIIMTCVWLIVVRQIIAYQTEIGVLFALSFVYGFGRSMIIVCRHLSITEVCRPEQVPAAVGLGMLSMGVLVPPIGYFLGWIRDQTGSYIVCMTAQNVLMFFVLATWIPDMLLIRMRDKRAKKINVENTNQIT